MSMTPFRTHPNLILAIAAVLFAGMAFSQDKPDRPPWAQKPKSAKATDSTSTTSTNSTPTVAPTSAPDGQPGKIVQPTPTRPTSETQDTASQRGRIRVNVNLVNVLVSVLDDKNRPAPDLPKGAFQLFEEGV